MRRKDVFLAVLVGIFTGLLWTGVFLRLGTFDALNLGNKLWGLAIIIPAVFVFGLYLGQWLSRWKPFFVSFSRFVAVGFFNAGIDFGVFNLLMFLTGIEKGGYISLFKAVSFFAAVINSYFWNKHWSFEAGGRSTSGESGGTEFFKFLIITMVGAALNVGVTSGVIFVFDPMFGFGQLAWNNIAAVFGNIANLIWNFFGLRGIVFKKEAHADK